MDAGAIIAIYAAVVATAGFGWQVYTHRAARKLRVEVRVRMALLGLPDAPEAIAITVINRSEQAVNVSGAGIDLQDGSGRSFHAARPPGADLPGRVESGDDGMTYVLKSETDKEGLDVYKPVTAWARLATGDEIRSKPTRLLSR